MENQRSDRNMTINANEAVIVPFHDDREGDYGSTISERGGNGGEDIDPSRSLGGTSLGARAGMRPEKFPAKNERDLLLRKVRSVLNKISSVNYYRLRKRWLSLVPSNVDQVAEVLQLVVAKALDDVQYMNIYARLLGYLVNHRPPNSGTKIRSLLNAHIYDELAKLASDRANYSYHMEKDWIARRKKVTLYRFIAELFLENACPLKFLIERIGDILATYNRPGNADESLECICVVLTFAGQKIDNMRKDWLDELFHILNLKEFEKLAISKRVQFMVLDLLEMRSRSWVPHNKWWAPSVPVRQASSPMDSSDRRVSRQESENNAYLGSTDVPSMSHYEPYWQSFNNANCGSFRNTDPSCTIIGIMNKVSSSTLASMADHLANILPTDVSLLDDAVNTFLSKAIAEPAFAQIYANLIARAAEQVIGLDGKLRFGILNYVEGNLTRLGGMRVFAELYNVDLVMAGDLKHIIELLCISSGDACLESLCNLLFISGKKLDVELREAEADGSYLDSVFNKMMDRICSTTGSRLKCFIYDTIALRCNGWVINRPLNYIIPPVIDSSKKNYDISNIIRVVAKYGETNITMVRATICSSGIAEKFMFEGLCWAVETQSDEAIALIVRSLKIIMREKVMADVRPRFDVVLGQLVQHIAVMKYRYDNAWTTFGKIMEELYG